MAKKKQLNVRLPDTLFDRLEQRVLKTKMGMAAMVEVLLLRALEQESSDAERDGSGDRFDVLVKRIEALEAKLSIEPDDSHLVEASIVEAVVAVASIADFVASEPSPALESDVKLLSAEDLALRLSVTVRALAQKKDKSTFSDWTRKHDPEGVAWKYIAPSDRFCPLVD